MFQNFENWPATVLASLLYIVPWGYSLLWPILGGSSQKRYFLKASGISLVEVDKGLENLAFPHVKRPKGLIEEFVVVKKS